MNEVQPVKLSRLELLRAGAIGVSGITLLSSLIGAGCASEKLVTESGPPPTDPKLVKYREIEPIKTDFHWSRGIASTPESIWVAGDMAIKEFDPTGKLKQTVDLQETAKAVALTPSGRVLVATEDRVMPIGGAPFKSRGPSSRIVSIAATQEHIFIADAGNRLVVAYDHLGNVVSQFGSRSADDYGLVVPSPFIGLSIHPSGDLLVTNIGMHRVERRSPDGKLVSTIGHSAMEMTGFCGCCNPTHVSALPNGDIVTSEKGLPRIKVLSPTGELKCVVAGPERFHSETLGMATSIQMDRILVLDPWEASVRIFVPI